MNTARTCENCTFFRLFANRRSKAAEKVGQCRRHSPTRTVDAALPRGEWPHTTATDWCGDFDAGATQ